MIFSKTIALQPDMQASSALRSRRMTVVFNPTAGGRRRARLDETLKLLRASGCEVAVQATAARGDAETIARGFGVPPQGQDLLVIAGGDGTINEAVNGLLSAGGDGASSMALVPLGTANVLANEIGLATAPAAVARAIAGGASVRAYVGAASNKATYYMVHLAPGADRDAVRRRLDASLFDAEALTPGEFRSRSRSFWLLVPAPAPRSLPVPCSASSSAP